MYTGGRCRVISSVSEYERRHTHALTIRTLLLMFARLDWIGFAVLSRASDMCIICSSYGGAHYIVVIFIW